MRTRPWPILILAFVQILTPVFNIFANSLAFGVAPSHILRWLFQGSPLQIFEFLALMPIAGIAIAKIRKWSYPVFFAAMAWALVRGFWKWHTLQGTVGTPFLFCLTLLEILLVVYFLLPSVRTAYFDPTVRWWESKPRYLLEIPAHLTASGEDTMLLNLSEGGAFVKANERISSGNEVNLRFSILSQPFVVAGKIVHSRELPQSGFCYGIRFEHTPETRERFHNLAHGLRLMGFEDRGARTPSGQGLGAWLSRLIRTGKGWKPEIEKRGG